MTSVATVRHARLTLPMVPRQKGSTCIAENAKNLRLNPPGDEGVNSVMPVLNEG